MKLKTATLLALISMCIILIIAFINTIISFAEIVYSDGLKLWYNVSGIFYLLAWGSVAIFFYTLYKNQK